MQTQVEVLKDAPIFEVVPTPKKPSIDMREVTNTVKDLLTPSKKIFWNDLLGSSTLAWTSFALFVAADSLALQALGFTVATFALYRCLFFIHELTHLSSKSLPGFNSAWNALVGVPLMVPSFMYEGVHLDHHRRHKYGTEEDPEYLPLGVGPRFKIVLFVLSPVLFPIGLALRTLVLAPLCLLIPPAHRLLETYASALVINNTYKRAELSATERRRMKIIEVLTFAVWSGLIFAFVQGVLPIAFFWKWYFVGFGVSFVNQIRTLVAHRYNNASGEMAYEDQLLDSVNVEGGLFTELWAPVGARYHALHHYCPKLPYHSLPEAHRRMKVKFADNPLYSDVNERSFVSAFRKLWKA